MSKLANALAIHLCFPDAVSRAFTVKTFQILQNLSKVLQAFMYLSLLDVSFTFYFITFLPYMREKRFEGKI